MKFRGQPRPAAAMAFLAFCVSAWAAHGSPAHRIPAGRPLQDLPGLTIDYYDVAGTDVQTINDSILAQQDDEISTSSNSWDAGTHLDTRDVDGRCSITDARVKFSARVRLPRLTTEKKALKEVREAWRAYVKGLENRQAADLWFVYDRLPSVETAVRRSDCKHALAAASAEVAKIKAAEAAYMRKFVATANFGR